MRKLTDDELFDLAAMMLEQQSAEREGKKVTITERKRLKKLLEKFLGDEVMEKIGKLTILEMCSIFDINRRSLEKYVEAGCPRNPDRSFDLKQVFAWLRLNARKKAKEADCIDGDDNEPTTQAANLRQEYLGRLAALDYEKKMGLVLDRSQLQTAWLGASNILRTAGESLQKKYGLEAKRILDESLDEAHRIALDSLQKVYEAIEAEEEQEKQKKKPGRPKKTQQSKENDLAESPRTRKRKVQKENIPQDQENVSEASGEADE